MPAPRWHNGQRRDLPPLGSQVKDEDAEPRLSQAGVPPPPTQLERPPDCINKFPTPNFGVLTHILDRLRTEKAIRRSETLSRFMDLWRLKVGNDLYPLIRLLLPDRDRERPVYNLKEAMMAKCYIEVLGLDKNSDAAQRLIKWKQPVEGQGENSSGDFARVCYHVIHARSTVEVGTFTVEAVNIVLDKLARGRLKQSEIVPILREVNERCTPSEQEWIIRIILKDLRIQIREKGVFGCLHPEANALFNVCSDLKRVCWTLYKPDIHLEKTQTNIELFRCFLPQLCYRSPTSSHDAIAKLVGAPDTKFIMEEKLDGERIQLHMRNSGKEWFYCSRKAKDYTYLYGAHEGEGSLTQFISEAFRADVNDIILDGEMLVWDPALEKYLAFGSLKTAALDKSCDENAPRPCFKVFDVLLVNGHCLTGKRLSERKALLQSRIFKDLDQYRGRIELVDEEEGKSGKEIRAMLDRILEKKGEGIVVKRASSQYVTNSRDADWVKVKPEYADQMGENMELLVLGGWWGKGGRTGKISSLLLGLRVQQDDDGSGKRPRFKTFASVGSGMSYEDYEWILTHHKDHWKPFDRNNPPPWLELGATGVDDKPDVYIEPEKSFVIDVKASEIVVAAGGYGAGYTLRFPRCRFIHWDKNSRNHPSSEDHRDRDMWNCLSFDEFTVLHQQGPKKRYLDDGGGATRKRRRVTGTTRRQVQVFEGFRGQRLSDDLVESSIFKDMTFFIPKDSPDQSKSDLEKLVHRYGGDFTQQQLADRSALVISHDDKSPRVTAQIRKGVSIIKPQWITESIKRHRPLPLLKEFLASASPDDHGGRYYNKTLAQYDQISLVRDRTGADADDEVEEEEEEPIGEDEEEPSPPPTAGQLNAASLAADWGMGIEEVNYSYVPRQARPTYINSSEEYGDTDDERGDHEEEDDYEDNYDDDEVPTAAQSTLPPTIPSTMMALTLDSSVQQEQPLFRVLDPQNPPDDYEPMGEEGAAAYDEDMIFKHLVFYIDTAENATLNGFTASDPPAAAAERLARATSLLRENGGRIVTDILDSKLTHVVMDDDDAGRYVEIARKASKPKYKHIVLPSWVEESVEEETLMDEDSHKPK